MSAKDRRLLLSTFGVSLLVVALSGLPALLQLVIALSAIAAAVRG